MVLRTAVLTAFLLAIACGGEPPDTSSVWFAGTECEDRNTPSEPDGDCWGNLGCTRFPVQCGQCVCVLCADDYCLQSVCDDGGPGC